MPISKAPMLSLKGTADRPKTRPRPRRAETASPPKRSNTRKVNVVSQASLAMLNPAYAMGIEAGPSWQEEEEARWRRERAGNRVAEARRPSGDRHSPMSRAPDPSPWSMDPTPELEAFLSTETMEYQLEQQEGGALGLVLQAPGMERKVSSESVFEDDEPLQVKRRPNAGPNASTLSRFFTWKRSPRGKTIIALAPSPWEVPQSAPPHMQTFDRPSLDMMPRSTPPAYGNTSPRTPLDVFGSTAILKTNTKTMSRKTSMPTLRDIRRAVGSPVGQEVPLPDVKPVDAAASFYWRTEMPKTPTIGSSGTLTPSSSTGSTSTGGKSTPRTNSRVSSLGRGLASRKSTVEVPMIDESPSRVSTKKKQQQQQQPQSSPRHDPWSMQNMPPLPTNISIASLIAAEEEEERNRSQDRTSAASSMGAQNSRRRSRSVGALPSLSSFTVATLPSTPVIKCSDEAGLSSDAVSTRIVRVSVANRSIIGTASPKLLVRDVHSPMSNSGSPRRKNALLQVSEPTVVVNVMPPTPDLGSGEQETFECSSLSASEQDVMSPGQHEPEEELPSLVEGHSSPRQEGKDTQKDLSDADEAVLAYTIGDRYDEEVNNDKHDSNDNDNDDKQSNGLSRSDSMRSDLSRSTDASAATDMTEGIDDPFGFARSMSTMSLSSELSDESNHVAGEEQEDEEGDENDSDCCDAKIMSASSTVSSFSRAQFVSPRTRELSSWNSLCSSSSSSSQSLSSSVGGVSSLPSLTSSLVSSPSKSVQSTKRRSKRFSGMPSLAGQSLASVMTGDSTGTKVGGLPQNGTLSNLSSPVELQGQVDEADCDTPRLSGGCNASTMAACLVNTTKPLNVRKGSNADQTKTVADQQLKQDSPHHPNAVLSPPRPFPRAHNAESPHLELDLSLPLDLHDIGLGLEVEEVPQKRERPRLPQKSRARMNNRRSPANATGEPTTPPSTNRLLASVMQEDRNKESFGLGLGLGLDNTMDLVATDGKPISPTQAQIWQRPRRGFYASHHSQTASHGSVGFAI